MKKRLRKKLEKKRWASLPYPNWRGHEIHDGLSSLLKILENPKAHIVTYSWQEEASNTPPHQSSHEAKAALKTSQAGSPSKSLNIRSQ